MTIAKPTCVVIALCAAPLSHASAALSQAEVGHISCKVVLDYVGTNSPYYVLFHSFLEGYLAGGKSASMLGRDERDTTARMSEAIDYCRGHQDADFEAAIAATVNEDPKGDRPIGRR
jgi:hypothetical protein